jgi:hypothetical protein
VSNTAFYGREGLEMNCNEYRKEEERLHAYSHSSLPCKDNHAVVDSISTKEMKIKWGEEHRRRLTARREKTAKRRKDNTNRLGKKGPQHKRTKISKLHDSKSQRSRKRESRKQEEGKQAQACEMKVR